MFRCWGSAEDQRNQPPPHGMMRQNNLLLTFRLPRLLELLTSSRIKVSFSDDELRKLSQEKDSYNQFLLSIDQIKVQNNLREELRKETLHLAEKNLEKEPQIMELQNQSTIIRTTEFAAAQERYSELERRKEETLKAYSTTSLLLKLHNAMNEIDDESDSLHGQLLSGEVDPGVFLQKYKRLCTMYHRRELLHFAAKTSVGNG